MPPPAPTRSRAEPPVYHPPLLHRDPRHTHPMVTRQASQPRVLTAATYETGISPVPSSVREALSDIHWCHAMEEEYAALLANHT